MAIDLTYIPYHGQAALFVCVGLINALSNRSVDEHKAHDEENEIRRSPTFRRKAKSGLSAVLGTGRHEINASTGRIERLKGKIFDGTEV